MIICDCLIFFIKGNNKNSIKIVYTVNVINKKKIIQIIVLSKLKTKRLETKEVLKNEILYMHSYIYIYIYKYIYIVIYSK